MSLKKFIVDKKGQWKHPGKNTMIPDANGRITMKGVNDVLLGIDDQGNKKIMLPGKEYQFPGNDVYEIPLSMKKKQMGGAQDDQQMLLDMVQQYAQAIGADPNQIMQELQSAGPEEQQQMMQQIMEAVQQGIPEENPFQAQLGGAPPDHTFAPPPQEIYAPMDMSSMYSQGVDNQMQMGGSNDQAMGYMGKTNNFVNWLRNKAMTANMEQMNQMMMKFGGNLSKMQTGGNYLDKQGFYHNVNKEAAYMTGNTQQQPNPDYNNYNPVFNPLNGGYSSLFTTQMPVIPSKLPRDMAIKTNPNTKTYTKSSNTNPVVNQNQNTDQIFDQTTTNDNTDPVVNNTSNWQREWYDPNKTTQQDVTNPMLSNGYNNSYNQVNNGYSNNTPMGYGSGNPYFNFGYPSFGGGLLNFIPNMIMALGSLGQMGRMGNNNPIGRNGQRDSIHRDNRPEFNKKRTVGLDYSNDPFHKGDKGNGIKSLEQGKYPNHYMSYEDEIKLLAEQNAPTSADRTQKAFDFLKKKKAVKTGGIMKAQDGTEIDLQNPDYFDLQYNMYPYGQDIVPDQDVMYTDPNKNFAPPAAQGPQATPAKSEGTGFQMGNNPFMAEGIISDINAITAMKNQGDQAKADRLQKRQLNDVTKSHSSAKKTNRGDWFSGPGLGFGMFRPNQNIYSGPNAFAKKGGTFFNSNFYQDGGENESQEFDYIEGDEMFLSDDQIQKLLDAGADIEFL